MEERVDVQTAKREIGRRIIQWRGENGNMTAQALADRLGIARPTLTNIENGNQVLKFDQLYDIALVTNIDFSDILRPQRSTSIVIDTSVILQRLQSLRHFADLCDHLHVPRTVVDEINNRKDRSRTNQERADASKAISEIVELRKAKKLIIEEVPDGRYRNNDDRIFGVAEYLARSHGDTIVYLLAKDKDFGTKGKGDIRNLIVVSPDELDVILRQDDVYVTRNSQVFFRTVKEAKKPNDIEASAVKELVGRGRIDVNYVDPTTGRRPLHQAIENRNRKMVNLLLRLPEIDVNAVDKTKYGFPPISLAIQKRDKGIVADLIDAGANVNEPSSGNVMNPYNTPLMVASWQGSLDFVKLLVEHGACINQQDKLNGYTALIKAARQNKAGVVRYLLECGADTTICSWERKTALDYNIDKGYGSQGEAIRTMLMEASR